MVDPVSVSAATKFVVSSIIASASSLFRSRDTDLNRKQRARFEAAGGNVIGKREGAPRGRPRYEWQGERVSKKEAKRILRQLDRAQPTGGPPRRRNPPTPQPRGDVFTPTPPVSKDNTADWNVWNPWGEWDDWADSDGEPEDEPQRPQEPPSRQVNPDDWTPPGRYDVISAFQGPLPAPVPEVVTRTAPAVVRVLSRVLNPFLWVFWPSSTSEEADDWYPYEAPQRPRKGPARRPRVATPPARGPLRLPRIYEGPDLGHYEDRFPQPQPRPEATPREQPMPAPGTRPQSWPATPPIRAPIPAPSPAPTRTPLPFFPLPLFGTPQRPQFGRVRLPNPNTGNAPIPAPGLQPQPLPTGSLQDQCRELAKRKRKKRDPRRACYRGTYYESSTSTRKYRKERIPCR